MIYDPEEQVTRVNIKSYFHLFKLGCILYRLNITHHGFAWTELRLIDELEVEDSTYQVGGQRVCL